MERVNLFVGRFGWNKCKRVKKKKAYLIISSFRSMPISTVTLHKHPITWIHSSAFAAKPYVLKGRIKKKKKKKKL